MLLSPTARIQASTFRSTKVGVRHGKRTVSLGHPRGLRSPTTCSLFSPELAGAAAIGLAAVAAVPLGVVLDAKVDGGKRVDLLTNTVTSQGTCAYIARPTGSTASPAPVVLILHQFFGLREREIEMCDELAKLGYVAVAPDMFGRSSTGFIPRAVWLAYNAALKPGATWSVPELQDVVTWLEQNCEYADTSRLCVAGFCIGGGAALRYADSVSSTEKAPAVVVFYGRPLEEINGLRGPVLGIFGANDSQFPPQQVDAFEQLLEKNGIDASILRFEGCGHAFVTDLAATRKQGPEMDAWSAFTNFLSTNLVQ